MPVFLTAISTILGAVMFLRFGYATGNVGFVGVVAIIFLGHAVTIPTACAIAEIATNQKVQGGGEYFIISRSFGLTVGGAIGISLFLSQAISAAFYIIAFAEAFGPVTEFIAQKYGFHIADKRWFSVPTMILLIWVMLKKGADLGVKVLYLVVGVLFISLVFFFLGGGPGTSESGFEVLTATVENPDPFFYVFAICFPAFTGMTAGVGLSGDLANPKRSIPFGTLSATAFGMLIYMLIAYKLATSAAPDALHADQLIMGKIAIWGPIIPIGLACATLSSALGSMMVAPRTLQAIGGDGLFPTPNLNQWLSRGAPRSGEPVNATIVTSIIALGFLLVGDVNIVAEIISMFFMVTYGSICLISFLEHFAADPSYRPTFTSRWYISLFGALMCGLLMFQMNPGYALASIIIMTLIYIMISYFNPDKGGLSNIMQGVIFQVSRRLQVFLQTARKGDTQLNWRPSIVGLSKHSLERQSAFELVRWISHHHGFGTYIHFIEGYLSRTTHQQSVELLSRLIRLAGASRGRVFMDTLVSPSETTAICQVIQIPGVSGHENNGVLLEFSKRDPCDLNGIITNLQLITSANFDIYVLGSSQRKFGYRNEIHIWLSSTDFGNANLIILIGYILLGDPDWKRGTVKIFASYPEHKLDEEEEHLRNLIQAGRLPISQQNITMIPQVTGSSLKDLINHHSQEADLVIRGFRPAHLKRLGEEVFLGYEQIGDILFVHSSEWKEILSEQEINDAEATTQDQSPETKKPPAEERPEPEPKEQAEVPRNSAAPKKTSNPKPDPKPEETGS